MAIKAVYQSPIKNRTAGSFYNLNTEKTNVNLF